MTCVHVRCRRPAVRERCCLPCWEWQAVTLADDRYRLKVPPPCPCEVGT